MNIKRLFQPLVVTFVAAGAILAAAPVHAQDDPAPVLTEELETPEDPCNQEYPPLECLMPAVPVAPQFVDACGTDGDGVIIAEASEAYGYDALNHDGFSGGQLQSGFNAWTGRVIAYPFHPYYFPAGTQHIWEFEFSNTPCEEPVQQTINASLVLDCDGLPVSGYIVFGVAEPVDSMLSVEVSNATGTKGGLLYEGVVIPAGTVRYELSEEEIAAFRSQLELDSNVETFTGYLTTAKGGGYTTFPISLVEAPEDTCVAVGEPPVPPTTVPVTEPEIKVLETTGNCQTRTFTVKNAGSVVTGDTQFGVMLNRGNLPPTPIILQPEESIDFNLQVGETVSLGFSEEDSWTINGPSEFTAVASCVVDVDLGDDIIRLYGTVDPTDPATVMLPETGFPNVKVSQLAVLIVIIGGLLVLVARRPATV